MKAFHYDRGLAHWLFIFIGIFAFFYHCKIFVNCCHFFVFSKPPSHSKIDVNLICLGLSWESQKWIMDSFLHVGVD
jgi:hypothetical protein